MSTLLINGAVNDIIKVYYNNIIPNGEQTTIMLRLKKYLANYKLQLIVGPVCKFTEAVFELIIPLIVANIIDTGIASGDRNYILRKGGLMIFLGVLGLACALTCQYLASAASQGVGTELRRDLFRKINILSDADTSKFGTSSLVTRLNNDVNDLQQAVAMLIRLVVRAPFLVIGATVMAAMIDLKLSTVFLVSAPLVALALWLVMTKTVPMFTQIQKKLDRVALITRENLSGVRVVRAFSKQKDETVRFNEACDEVRDRSVRAGFISALLNPATYVIMNLSAAAVIWFGGVRVNSGALTQGQVIAFVNYLNQILLALIVVSHLVNIFTRAEAASKRVFEVFDTEPSVEGGSSTETTVRDCAVEFKNVSFSYEKNGESALKNLSVKAMKGETVGIIGPTGSGKSTLASLIPRFYDVDEGEVIVDGINVKEYTFEALRSRIGVVPQRAVLFTGTVADNLRWGNPEATQDDMDEALRAAQAYEFIYALPDKLESNVKAGGKNFSGGQRQRLTVARALIRKPQILILDDSSSALDYLTDRRMRDAIRQKLDGTTVFIISQRANAVMNADRIIVLDDGEVEGIGTHAELMESCAVYQEIVRSQDAPDKGGESA